MGMLILYVLLPALGWWAAAGCRHYLPTLEAAATSCCAQVEMWLVSKAGVPGVLPGVTVAPGERVLMEVSRKFTRPAIAQLAHRVGLCM